MVLFILHHFSFPFEPHLDEIPSTNNNHGISFLLSWFPFLCESLTERQETHKKYWRIVSASAYCIAQKQLHTCEHDPQHNCLINIVNNIIINMHVINIVNMHNVFTYIMIQSWTSRYCKLVKIHVKNIQILKNCVKIFLFLCSWKLKLN